MAQIRLRLPRDFPRIQVPNFYTRHHPDLYRTPGVHTLECNKYAYAMAIESLSGLGMAHIVTMDKVLYRLW